MKKFTFILVILTSTAIFLTNCNSVSEASKQGDVFYEIIKSKKFEEIIPLLDVIALDATPKEQWIRGLENNYSERGKIESFERTGFSTSIENDLNLIKLDYSVTYTTGTYKEQLELISRKDNFKVVTYKFSVK